MNTKETYRCHLFIKIGGKQNWESQQADSNTKNNVLSTISISIYLLSILKFSAASQIHNLTLLWLKIYHIAFLPKYIEAANLNGAALSFSAYS